MIMNYTARMEQIIDEGPQWRDRANRERFPLHRWGWDHWSTLGYVETRATDRDGWINWNHLTLSRRNWPMLWSARNPYEIPPAEDAADKYGLRLKGPNGAVETAFGHCEADALMDLKDHGFVEITMPPVSSTGQSYLRPDKHALSDPSPYEPVTGRVEWALMPWARFSLTERGWLVASRLREHLSVDKDYGRFTMPGELLEAAGS
jgi:hypothetical protein